LLLAACGQDESYFHDPTPTNLGKTPYDFATEKYPRDLSGLVLDDLGVEDGGESDQSIIKPDILEHPG
jgi:hypothetical protein